MKKTQQKVIDLPITGRDELNIIECPLTLLTDRATDGRKTLEFTDRQKEIIRHWTITGSDKYGLPCALDEPVFLTLLYLTKQQGFKSQKVSFNQHEMLKLMRWPNDGNHYHRLSLAFSRLSTVTIETDYLWDQGEFKKGKFIFHIIDRVGLYQGKRKNTKSSWFQWGEDIFKSFLNGNLKNLNLEIYFSLKTPISKRLYRLLDKRLYKNDQLSFDLKDLCYEKLGISRNLIYPSLLKQALSPALKEHKAKNLLSSTGFRKAKDGSWILTIKKCKDPEPVKEENLLTGSTEDQPKPKEDDLLEQLLFLKIPVKRAKIILQTYSRELIDSWMMALDLVKPLPRNRAGYLLKALEEKWELPEEVVKKRATEEQEREESLKEEYEKFIIAQVDEYLKTLDPQQVEQEMESYQEIFFKKYPHYLEFSLEVIKPYIKYDYKRTKAAESKLPTFEEWKKQKE